ATVEVDRAPVAVRDPGAVVVLFAVGAEQLVVESGGERLVRLLLRLHQRGVAHRPGPKPTGDRHARVAGRRVGARRDLVDADDPGECRGNAPRVAHRHLDRVPAGRAGDAHRVD